MGYPFRAQFTGDWLSSESLCFPGCTCPLVSSYLDTAGGQHLIGL